jgi:hypothetical protein
MSEGSLQLTDVGLRWLAQLLEFCSPPIRVLCVRNSPEGRYHSIRV